MHAWQRLPSRISPNKFEPLTPLHQTRVSREVACGSSGPGAHGVSNNSNSNNNHPAKFSFFPSSRPRMSREAADTAARSLRSAAEELATSGALSTPQAELCATNAECVTVAELGSAEGLARWLEARIPAEKTRVSAWGVDVGTKRVANLWTELVDGEISLEDAQPPKRTVHVASVKVRNEAGLYLIESHQEMADGRARPRNRPLSEKMRPGENVEDACRRGVYEELGPEMGARDRVDMVLTSYQREEQERDSFSYPGLLTRYVLHTMVALVHGLPDAAFATQEDEGRAPGNGGGALTNGHLTNGAPPNGHPHASAVGVKKHFWKWVTERELEEIMKRK